MVKRYSSVRGPTRVKHSITCRSSVAPWNLVLSVKLVVSTTSVSPSQWPTESPSHRRMVLGRCVAFMRTMRTSCTISVRIVTEFLVCTIWCRLL